MSTYAIAEIANLQYKLIKGQQIETQRVESKKDKTFKTDKVMMIKDGKNLLVGSPYIKGASVSCEVVRDFRGEKLISFKYKRRKKSRWKKGHRQEMSLLKVTEIKSE
ncbi:MAG: 50S ribosomal protein L21 [Candidatus Omnitrophica bacterium CG12_big_fil_rev_8_21_14_0_65_43_15]|uniref:Large ribosomal subunit protein bL21 n=1 Tax=Candidatus Taenaricola geysiri TaxID=1974752 RepID=A0A2J0LH14_9BACT|nr:MAG: 50S ribosomal protein L21 [Candidatus Omnitrophica bacterium CG1_02_43_210]PIR65676.1 MAG: 50S ribosomal protein L21 [Candidatus Omnitrophica bacterium CG10_big_fil_rev_8_21_14_0_10_43_8]PIV12495.1 MAG: 50S ribosomal protein L21 [Candidatus Omnitrophica bacterium CG03_land_8_20_14_0_80_43_22]PIW66154.1 MAG: 50S ribosomal protein L21 [Candidatus Omnitrophica bacterium CG12_big_fil_rev_8_21_14_0_65_43_15]PIW80507.1 MAG: 50S ribosomal protein L21 [Candidatus Omnitrophica bacterium CG_4_8_1